MKTEFARQPAVGAGKGGMGRGFSSGMKQKRICKLHYQNAFDVRQGGTRREGGRGSRDINCIKGNFLPGARPVNKYNNSVRPQAGSQAGEQAQQQLLIWLLFRLPSPRPCPYTFLLLSHWCSDSVCRFGCCCQSRLALSVNLPSFILHPSIHPHTNCHYSCMRVCVCDSVCVCVCAQLFQK